MDACSARTKQEEEMGDTPESRFRRLASCHGQAPSFTQTADFQAWAADKPPEFNALAYFEMVRERDAATHLEF